MTETEQRRNELLSQTRNLYREQNRIPAIHPRYGATYEKIYPTSSERKPASTLGIRSLIALFIFVIFAGIDYGEFSVLEYESDEIVAVLSQDIVLDEELAIDNLKNSW